MIENVIIAVTYMRGDHYADSCNHNIQVPKL